MVKHRILFLIGCLLLAGCSPFSGSNQTQSIPTFQPDSDLTSLTSNSPISTEVQGLVSTSSVFGKQPGELAANSGEFPASDQDVYGSQSSSTVDTEIPVAAESAALLQEIQGLVAQRRADLIPAEQGWLHLITLQTKPKANSLVAGDKPDGMIQQEQWLLLDNQGKVRANIKRTLDSEGPADSFVLWESGEWINLPLATISTASSSLPFDPNYGIYELLAHLARQGQAFNRSTIYKDCWYQGEKYTVSDGRIVHEVLFRPDYHALRWIKTWELSSGAIVLVDSLEIALEERLSQPPDEILALVDQSTP